MACARNQLAAVIELPKLTSMTTSDNPLLKLELPRRWELLEERAGEADVDPTEMVERVDEAADHVDRLLRRVRTGGGGLIEVIFGLSGSGKTTFLKTLPKFFDGVRLSSFPSEKSLSELPNFVRSSYVSSDNTQRVILIERRDNPKKEYLQQVEDTFAELLDLFREPQGAAVVLWPITRPDAADIVAQTAWQVGRDSMVDSKSEGQFQFHGVPKEKYFELADNTSRTLTGDGLEAFGVNNQVAFGLLPHCQTISDFFAAVDDAAEHVRDETWSVLRAKVRTHLWVVLPGDDTKMINSTTSALTQGTRSRTDVDLIGEFIDRPDNDSIYVADWKKRRGSLAHILRAVDVRLFGLPPSASLAAVRSFGSKEMKAKLKQPATNLDASKKAMKATRLYKAILTELGMPTTPYAGAKAISPETVHEFARIQQVASKDDKPLNKALGALIKACLEDDFPGLNVVVEKKALPGSGLQPDIQIEVRPGEFLCIEPSWRTSGTGVPGEVAPTQNTLSEAHVKKYVLEKTIQYVRDLGL